MAKKAGALTPMMQQFFSFKQQHPDALLLFRCGDFYETYGDDASDAAAILGITLTRRNNGGDASDPVAMAGFPYHALDTYLPKLIRAGRRVAICDQLEDPKLAKTIVKRGITELVTPGVTTSDTVLQARENNFLAAVQFGKAACGLALLDISTGEFLVGQGSTDYVDKLLASFAPKEVLYERGKRPMFEGAFGTRLVTFELDDWCFAPQTAQGKLLHHFGVHNLKGFGVDHLEEGVIAAGVVMQYLQQTQHTNLSHITSLRRIEEDRYVRLDKFTVRNLELLHAMNEDGHSLLDVIDHSVTPMGGRLLRRWIVFPLRDAKLIEERQDGVEYYFREPEFRQLATEQLQRIGDLERLTAKMSMGRITPREVQQLRISLDAIAPLKTACTMAHCESMQRIGEQLNACQSMRDRIAATLMPDPPLMVAKGRVIKEGFNAELDELRQIAFGGKDYLLQIQTREAAATGIQSLKIGFNNVFGYYLEVRNTYKDQVPAEWVRKQTLVGAERYITQELKEYEEKILGAEDKILALETRLYQELVSAIGEYAGALQLNASLIAQLDCLLSMAVCAEQNRYIRPVVNDSLVIDIRQGRHPVIERELPAGETYVANDVMLDDQTQQIIIVTGPNMAGKSALLRQTALICLLAQMGSFVPAASAHIGMVDKIFTRVGASDNISAGESTFMVEMSEAASILNNLSERSLVLFDELGRGTSTYDGISIARAIVEHIHDNPRGRARTLFATHYHELNELEGQYERIKNYNVSVKEVDGRVLFVRRLVPGGSEHSFGIHVAKLAGMPASIVKRANDILAILEQHAQAGVAPSVQAPVQQEGYQLSMFQLDDPVLGEIRDGILKLDIDNLTPVQALTELWRIKKILKGG